MIYCQDCIHFVGPYPPIEPGRLRYDSRGTCRRFPPVQATHGGADFIFPKVEPRWWCGEFKADPTKGQEQ